MTEMTQHPTSEQLDRFRAELLDQETSSALKVHVQHCSQCQQALAGWAALQEQAEASMPDKQQVAAQLKIARNDALSSLSYNRNPFFQPAMAVAASVALVASLALWQPWSSIAINPGQMVQLQEETTPELYEDLDFYLWLAGEQESAVSILDDKTVKT